MVEYVLSWDHSSCAWIVKFSELHSRGWAGSYLYPYSLVKAPLSIPTSRVSICWVLKGMWRFWPCSKYKGWYHVLSVPLGILPADNFILLSSLKSIFYIFPRHRWCPCFHFSSYSVQGPVFTDDKETNGQILYCPVMQPITTWMYWLLKMQRV